MGTYGIDNSILLSSLPLHLYATQTFWSMNIEIHVYQVFVLYCYISKTSVHVMIIVYVRVLFIYMLPRPFGSVGAHKN